MGAYNVANFNILIEKLESIKACMTMLTKTDKSNKSNESKKTKKIQENFKGEDTRKSAEHK